MFGKKRLAKKMLVGVDIIKTVLYKVLIDDFSEKYEDTEYYKRLVAAVVNEIFGDHTDISKIIFNENQIIVIEEIKNLGKNYPELKQPITDALRVYTVANHALGLKRMADIDYTMNLFNRAMVRGIFIKGGEAPKYDSFLKMATELGIEYRVFE